MAAAGSVGRRPQKNGLSVDSRRDVVSCGKGHRLKSIFVALLTLVAHAESQGAEGEYCLNDEGLDGICRHLRNCLYLQSKTSVFNGGGADTPDLCSFGASGTIVCCPTAPPKNPAPSPQITRAPAQRPTAARPPAARPPAARPPAPRPTATRRPAAPADSDTVVVVPAIGLRTSEQKCQEYMNSLDENETELRSGGISEAWCPYPPPGNELIVGGLPADYGDFPHMAALGYLTRGPWVKWLCSGSLISEYYVLTAAHCLRRDKASIFAVSLGAVQVTDMTIAEVKRKMEGAGVTSNIYPVAESLRHPKYSIFYNYDDIALIRLEIPVKKFGLQVRPACLPVDTRMDGINSAVACGFGFTEPDDPSTTRLLRHVNLTVYDSNVCSRVYSAVIKTSALARGIIDSQMCAGELAGGKDTCNGDSGGPLQVRDENDKCILRIIGVTSFGTGHCGAKNSAGVYTSIAHYLPWIEGVVWSTS